MPKEPAQKNLTFRGGKAYTPDNPPPESRRRVVKGKVVKPKPDTDPSEATNGQD